jgi:quercetin dioxygenase-like cupin family protein
MRRRTLPRTGHAVYRLAPNLLLVFKPRGHREAEHAHPHRQRLRVLRGALLVRTARRTLTLRADSRSLTLAAGRVHGTFAAQDTWLIAESLGRDAAAAR